MEQSWQSIILWQELVNYWKRNPVLAIEWLSPVSACIQAIKKWEDFLLQNLPLLLFLEKQKNEKYWKNELTNNIMKILLTAEKLTNYAAWYVLRYMPSRAKLQSALMKKSDNNETLVTEVMTEMERYIHEDRTVEGLVRMWIERGKTEQYIRMKLREKLFDSDVVERILGEYSENISSFATYEKVVEQRISVLLARGKSRGFILGTLRREYPRFHEEIEQKLSDSSSGDTESLTLWLEKLSHKHDFHERTGRQKAIASLLQKGFRYDDIVRQMEQK